MPYGLMVSLRAFVLVSSVRSSCEACMCLRNRLACATVLLNVRHTLQNFLKLYTEGLVKAS